MSGQRIDDERLLNLRDPRNLQIMIKNVGVIEERPAGFATLFLKGRADTSSSFRANSASIPSSSRSLQNRYDIEWRHSSKSESSRPTGTTLQPRKSFVDKLMQHLSAIDMLGNSSNIPPSTKPIKSQAFGDLTVKEAAEIIINKRGQFEMLRKELRMSGIITNFGAQQVLLQSILQARFDEIDAQWRQDQHWNWNDGNIKATQVKSNDSEVVPPRLSWIRRSLQGRIDEIWGDSCTKTALVKCEDPEVAPLRLSWIRRSAAA